MNKKNLEKVSNQFFTAMRKLPPVLIMALFLPCMAACSSKEAVLLESDDIVMEKRGTEEDSVSGENAAEAMVREPAPALQAGVQQTVTEENVTERNGTDETDSAGQQGKQSTLFVHICGEVISPGVYELPAGSRIYEAVEEAGGFTPDAEKSHVNLAQLLEDGCKIRIPAAGEEISEETELYTGMQAERTTGGENGLVDINSADKQQLCTLPGIGESRAESIIAYREKNGGFKMIEDIMRVEGIKDGMFAKLKDKICVRGVK